MTPQLLSHDAFTVIGALHHGNNDNGELPALWHRAVHALNALPSAEPGVSYGVLDHFDPVTRTFDYLAATPVAPGTPVPDGMVAWDIPAQTCAVFDTTLPALMATIHDVYHTYLPTSGYRRGAGPEFERYDERFTGSTDPEVQILTLWIPITPALP